MAARTVAASVPPRLGGLWWLALRKRAWARARPHALPLAVVLLAFAIGQAAVLTQRPLVFQWPDTAEYLDLARGILFAHHFTDPLRTVGYPAFLALIFALTGWKNLGAVVVAQAGLMLVTTLEIYLLVYHLYRRRALSGLIAGLMAVNPLVMNWERTILTETLCYFLLVTLFLVFARYLATERMATLLWFALLCVAAILTRPQFLYLPATALFVLALRSLRRGDLRRRARPLALVCALAYVPILAYMAANALNYGYFGLSSIANLNLFGKVLEYHLYQMPDAATDPRYAHFQADVQYFMAHTRETAVVGQVWSFVKAHPEYDAHYWAIYGAYSSHLIERHPLYFVEQIGSDLWSAAFAPPDSFARFPYLPFWIAALIVLFICATLMCYSWSLLLITSAVRAWRHPDRATTLITLTLLLTIAGNALLSGTLDFTQFGRLRFPLDWAMTLVFVVAVVECAPLLARARERLRRAVTRSWRGAMANMAMSLAHLARKRAPSLWAQSILPLVILVSEAWLVWRHGLSSVQADAIYYVAMTQHPFGADPLVYVGPYLWRLLTPLVARTLPLPITDGFWLVTMLGLAGIMCACQSCLRGIGLWGDAIFLGGCAWLALGPATGFLLFDYLLVDPLTYLLFTSALACAVWRKGTWLGTSLVLFSLSKEIALLAALFACLWAVIRGGWVG